MTGSAVGGRAHDSGLAVPAARSLQGLLVAAALTVVPPRARATAARRAAGHRGALRRDRPGPAGPLAASARPPWCTGRADVGQSIELHPVVVLLALTTGTVVAGIVGALLTIPVAAVIWIGVSHFRDRRADAAPQ